MSSSHRRESRRSSSRHSSTKSRSRSRKSSRNSQTSVVCTDVPSGRNLSVVAHNEKARIRRGKSAFLLRAEKKDRRLLCMEIFQACAQALAMVMVIVCGLFMHANEPEISHDLFYYVQVAIEAVALVVIIMSACSATKVMRVVVGLMLVSMLLLNALFIGMFLATSNVNRPYFCDKDFSDAPLDACLGGFTAYYHALFVSIALFGVHFVLAILSLFIIVIYEGSFTQYYATAHGRKILAEEQAKSMAKPHSSRRRRSRKHSKKQSRSCTESLDAYMSCAVPGTIVMQTVKTEELGQFKTGKDGSAKPYGAIVTSTVETSARTPEGTSSKKVIKKRKIVPDGHGKYIVQDLPVVQVESTTCGASSKSGKSELTSKSEKSEAFRPVNQYNSVSRMPALVSPIGYLNRNQNKPDKKSHYIV